MSTDPGSAGRSARRQAPSRSPARGEGWEERLRRTASPPGPLYGQIKARVLEAIAEGVWRKGDRLPSEKELAQALAASRLTVHRALRELTEAGSLRRVHGVGTFVASARPESPLTRLHNIADEIRARGERLTSRVLRLQRVRADAALAALFGVERGQPLFHSVVVYSGDGVPLQLEDRYVLPSFAPDYLSQDFTRGSTTDHLQAIAAATDAEIVIDALIPGAAEARLLELGPQEPALAVTRKTWVGSRVTTWTRFLHPGGRHRIVLRNLGGLGTR